MDRAAIIGIGMTKIEARKVQDTFADMAWEAVNKALDDAGITINEIDNVITTSNDFFDGRTISCMAVGDASGVRSKNCSCVEGDGTFGAFYGLARALSGSYGTTLVTAHSKGSESVSSLITNAAFDPIYNRALGMDMISACAMQANAYMHRTGTTPEQLALVSVKNHGNAKRNPLAQLPMTITVKDVLKSEMIADPLHKLDCSPVSDGCCAVIIANEERAKPHKKRAVWIKGAAFCSDAYFLGDRDLSKARSLTKAAKKAYGMAGIKNPMKEIDVAEVYDAFTYQELMWLEALGLSGKEGPGKKLEKGYYGLKGKLPVNPSGGLLSGHPVIAAGLIRIAEAVKQLRGEAGKYQVKGAKTALAHGVNGLCGQSHCVWILGKEK
jgi:acetyl-CoA C-acetyltransferase